MTNNWKPIKIAYDITDPSNGLDEKLNPIILLHGISLTKDDWNHVDLPLADATHRRVYKLDARNHGDSEWSDEFDLDILAKDVNHFMEEHKIPKAVLIGHSMGGRMTMQVAGKYPEKCEKIIIEDMPLVINKDLAAAARGVLELKNKSLDIIPANADLAQAKATIKEYFLEKIFVGTLKDSENERTRDSYNIEIDLAQNDEGGFRWKANYDILCDEKFFTELCKNEFDKSFNGSSLFIYGPKSAFRVMNQKESILERFPEAVFKGIADATHIVHAEYPEEFVKVCSEFIQQD